MRFAKPKPHLTIRRRFLLFPRECWVCKSTVWLELALLVTAHGGHFENGDQVCRVSPWTGKRAEPIAPRMHISGGRDLTFCSRCAPTEADVYRYVRAAG